MCIEPAHVDRYQLQLRCACSEGPRYFVLMHGEPLCYSGSCKCRRHRNGGYAACAQFSLMRTKKKGVLDVLPDDAMMPESTCGVHKAVFLT